MQFQKVSHDKLNASRNANKFVLLLFMAVIFFKRNKIVKTTPSEDTIKTFL